MTLFDDWTPTPKDDHRNDDAPLAERLRPRTLEEIVGLDELLAPGRFLRNAIEADRIPSMILWGPPGSGKTTLARIIASTTRSRFVTYSATSSSIKDVRALMDEAARDRRRRGARTIVFIDEIHRFNKAQQDAFLPYVEAGDIVLIGATTENPSFEVNSALLSRSKVIVIPRLEHEHVRAILNRAIADPTVVRHGVTLTDEGLDFIASISGGDGRQALNSLQLVVETGTPGEEPVAKAEVRQILHQRSLAYDKTGEEHYNIISALHKSIRNGDADAAVYWLVRMLEGGEDPLYIARRVVRAASEDIGLADPEALRVAVSAKEAVAFIGMPEGGVALAEAVIYLCQAPKSNAVYTAYEDARHEVRTGDTPPVPLHLRNASTTLMKDAGYGKGYQYAHDFEEQTAPMDCLPEALSGRRFYKPRTSGRESEIRQRLEALEKARNRGDSSS